MHFSVLKVEDSWFFLFFFKYRLIIVHCLFHYFSVHGGCLILYSVLLQKNKKKKVIFLPDKSRCAITGNALASLILLFNIREAKGSMGICSQA